MYGTWVAVMHGVMEMSGGRAHDGSLRLGAEASSTDG